MSPILQKALEDLSNPTQPATTVSSIIDEQDPTTQAQAPTTTQEATTTPAATGATTQAGMYELNETALFLFFVQHIFHLTMYIIAYYSIISRNDHVNNYYNYYYDNDNDNNHYQ